MKLTQSLGRQWERIQAWLNNRVWSFENDFKHKNAGLEAPSSRRTRLIFIICLVILLFTIVIGFAVRASLSNPKQNILVAKGLEGARGALVDRHGALLVSDVAAYNLYVNYADVPRRDHASLTKRLKMLYPEAQGRITDLARLQKRGLLKSWLSEDDRQNIFRLGLPGLSFETRRKRSHPLGRTGAFYVGFTELGGKGIAFSELAFDEEIRQAGINNQSFYLAMDLRVQSILEQELISMAKDQKALSAVGIITNARTGEVLALSSWPDFDPNQLGAHSEFEKRNRASADVYEVGSIMKVITVAIGLDSGTVTSQSVFDATQPLQIGDRVIHDFHAQNRVMTLEEIFLKSSNIGTSKLLMQVGSQTSRRYFEQLNLLKPAQIEIKGPVPPIYEKSPWTRSDLSSISFGSGISISPLSFAQALGATVNGGRLMPLTMKKIETEGNPQHNAMAPQVFQPSTTEQVLVLMRSNVVRGSGTRSNAPGLRVGGKTGSAEKPVKGGIDRKNLISSFAAVFPTDGGVDQDRYVVLIMFDSPQGSALTDGQRLGGYVAAPVAGRVINRIAPFLGVERKDDRFTPKDWDHAPVINDDQTGASH